jgi:DNA primase
MLTDTYTQNHVKRILQELSISINSESHTDFLCFCPFHGNRNTPSFSVSYTKGLYICFNPSCDAAGTVLDLVKQISHRNDFEALRFIQSLKAEAEISFEDELAALLEDKPEFVPFDQAKLDDMYLNLLAISTDGVEAQFYLSERFIGSDLINEFRIGYSINQKMIIVPVHSPDGIPVGLVGRGIHEKKFKNSRNLPRSKTLFNLHRAKRCGGTVIVCESSFDAIRIHGAGFPNVVATLGGFISRDNLANLNRYFNKIIIMTDFDNRLEHIVPNCRKCYPQECEGHNPGRDLGMSIANTLKGKDIQWAMFDEKTVYPHGAKDAGDLSDLEIVQCIKNTMSHVEYTSQNIY